MGSLSSRPKAPAVTPVQYVYAAPASVSAPVSVPVSVITSPDISGDEEVKAQARANNLLERRRGRLGTVLTSFRGLLGDTLTGARKTLLGE